MNILRLAKLSTIVGIVAVAGCTPGARECAKGTVMLNVKCAEGLNATAATATITRREDGKSRELALNIDCSTQTSIQIEIPDYLAGQTLDAVIQPTKDGVPVARPTMLSSILLKSGCVSVHVTLENTSSSVEDAAMPAPDDDAGVPMTGNPDVAELGPPSSKDRGEACVATSECKEGACADGVCCETACEGQCVSCNQAGSPGLCRPLAKGDKPATPKSCMTESAESCGFDGTCDGEGKCAKHPDGTVCAKGECDVGGTKGRKVCQAGACAAPDEKVCAPYACDATTVTCFAKCAGSDQCVAGRACMDESCGKKPLGAVCGANAECLSDKCADGVCCNTGCGGSCEACNLAGKVGECTAVAKGAKDPHDVCKADAVSTCQKTGVCDGARGCALFEAKTVCTPPSCSGNSFVSASQCDGAGRCVDGSTSACAPFACKANACVNVCESNADCVGGTLCLNGSCGKKDNGASCAADTECKNGFCRDKVCCDGDCAGPCRSCAAAGNAGKCTMTAASVNDPRNMCARENSSTCGLDGMCNGAGACSKYPSGTQCEGASCNASTNTGSFRHDCNGSGVCQQTKAPESCAPGHCAGSTCTLQCTKDGDCVAPNTCVNSLCGRKPAGQVCSAASECQSGNCVDGVCCTSACGGACRSCNLPGKAGVCELVGSGVRDPRSVCTDQGSASCGNTGNCDGGGTCSKYSSGTECKAQTCDSGQNAVVPKSTCNGSGSCAQTGSNQPCGNYKCGATSCLGTCTNDNQCNSPNSCVLGECKQKLGNGGGCSNAAQCASGVCAQGVCCNAACDGVCRACDLGGSVGACTTKPAGAVCGSSMSCQGSVCCATPPAGCVGENDFCSQDGKSVVSCRIQNGCLAQTGTILCAGPANGSGQCSGGTCSGTPVCNPGFNLCLDKTCRTECPGLLWLSDAFACPRALSDDGSVVVNTFGETWTSAGRTTLPTPVGMYNMRPMDISGDGKVVVGYAQSGSNNFYYPIKWPLGQTPVQLDSTSGRAFSVSQNGSVVYGNSGKVAFRWAGGVRTTVGDYLSPTTTYDCTATGGVVVGMRVSAGGFKWTMIEGLSYLDSVSGAAAITSSGSKVVGTASNGRNLVLWANGTVQDLPSEFRSLPYGSLWEAATDYGADYDRDLYQRTVDISGDGSKVLGLFVVAGGDDSEHDAAIWAAADGSVKKLSDILLQAGMPLAPGQRLNIGTAISRDGRVVIGCGSKNNDPGSPKGYRIVLP